jgi:hypothetical protein
MRELCVVRRHRRRCCHLLDHFVLACIPMQHGMGRCIHRMLSDCNIRLCLCMHCTIMCHLSCDGSLPMSGITRTSVKSMRNFANNVAILSSSSSIEPFVEAIVNMRNFAPAFALIYIHSCATANLPNNCLLASSNGESKALILHHRTTTTHQRWHVLMCAGTDRLLQVALSALYSIVVYF